MVLELVPIGTILAVLTNQVVKTAQAANDVIVEKESFKILSKHLFDIELVLKELQLQKLNDSEAARQALEFLEQDVKKANNLVEKYKNRASFYLLIKCRHIVKEVQDVTRDIGKSLAALSLANTDVLSRMSDQVHRLQDEMQSVEFKTSQSQLEIVDKLNQGLSQQNLDQGFANDMLEEIARAVGVPVEPSEISKELASFRREKEEAANRKERAEVFFLEQVIELLSRADAARDYEEIKRQYHQRIQVIERYDTREDHIPPLNSFVCPISGEVMVDPVSICTGTTCERSAIEDWFYHDKRTDPVTGDLLKDLSLRSNLPLRQSIEEWRELNFCLKIRSAKAKLQSGMDSSVKEALDQMQALMVESSINKDWITIGGLIDIATSLLGSSENNNIKRNILITLTDAVEGHARNKDRVVECQGVEHIVHCLECDSSISEAALELLYELLQDSSGWNMSVCRRISQQSSSIHFLVTLLKGTEREAAEKAEAILLKLCDEDEKNISASAKEDWFKPLINCILQGAELVKMVSMARIIVEMELVDRNLKILGEEGIIPPLLQMASGNLETKDLFLSLILKLLNCPQNKVLLANAGGVPLVLKLMFSSPANTRIIAKSSQVLEKLCSDDDGLTFLVDENGTRLELEPVVTNLLALQENSSSNIVRKPALRALLGICKSEPGLVKMAIIKANGVSLVLPLLDDPDPEIRETTVSLLFLFSEQELEGVVEYLLKPRRLEALVGFLEKDDVQMAAAGLLGNLPISKVDLTKKLIELDGLNAIINILKTGTMEAKENALSALFRFTDPTNLESQKIVVELGAYPLLVNFLKDGSVTAKARAAALIGKLSLSTPILIAMSKPTGCWCFIARSPLCSAHGGICSVNSTFCLLKANALPELVKLLQEEVHETASEAIPTLSTLVQVDCPNKGTNVLHEADAINPILAVLRWGTCSLKEEALELLEKVFVSREMVELYGFKARLHLTGMTGGSIHENGRLGRRSARVLAQIERYSRSLTPRVSGVLR
ncbi:U-box domain [Dillenia turbinata]|uniref:RING-type E3 ubiquitin transferase n=1 Tax=Dillenia turbinata TaxID=194707 RepID=A0AAN8Z9E5_9MAGN